MAPTGLTAVGNTLYFTANDGSDGPQLWGSDGTAAGTAMLADINGTTGAGVSNLTGMGGELYFTAYTTASGYQVWQSDGTAGGTEMDTSLTSGLTSVPSNLAGMGTSLYFLAPGAALWQWQAPAAGPVTPTITWADPASISYGTALSSAQLDATASVPGTFSLQPGGGDRAWRRATTRSR